RPVSLYVTLLVCHGQLPGAIVDLDAMGCAEFEKMRFGFLRQIEKRLCAGEAEITLHFLRPGALACAKLAAVAARGAVAEAMSIHEIGRASCRERVESRAAGGP